MISWINLIRIALKALVTNKLRSVLTILGIIVGVASVVILVSIGAGLQGFVTELFTSLGANNLYVFPGKVDLRRPGSLGGRQVSKFELADITDLNRASGVIKQATPMVEVSAVIAFRGESTVAGTVGVWENYFTINNFVLDSGRLITQNDVNRKRRVVVLGSKVVKDIFGETSPLGKDITVNDVRYEVVGTLKSKGGGGIGESIDNHIFIPLSSAFRQFDLSRPLAIHISVTSPGEIDQAVAQVEEVLLSRLKPNDFTILQPTDLLGAISQFIGTATLGLAGIAAISLLVGGIGIMNIMLVSVTERTREIGLRKAVGATPRAIMMQFLIEAVMLSLTGGVIGTSLGMGTGAILNRFIPVHTPIWAVVVAFGVSTLVGIVFGILPARRAAKLSPIEALRYE